MTRFRSPLIRTSRTNRWGAARRLASWWSLWRVPALVTVVAALWWFVWRPVADSQGWDGMDWTQVDAPFVLCGTDRRRPATHGCVIDGDTVMLYAPGTEPRRIRLTGFDAPELEGSCPAETALAKEAREALASWLAIGPFEWSGGGDPPRDQYGRELRSVRRAADDGSRERLADTMIDAGLARESGWGAQPVDWCR